LVPFLLTYRPTRSPPNLFTPTHLLDFAFPTYMYTTYQGLPPKCMPIYLPTPTPSYLLACPQCCWWWWTFWQCGYCNATSPIIYLPTHIKFKFQKLNMLMCQGLISWNLYASIAFQESINYPSALGTYICIYPLVGIGIW